MFLKHKQFMDVCIEVRSLTKNKDGALKIYGTFWNLGQSGTSFPIGEDVRLKIDEEAAPNWEQCLDGCENLREAKWLPLK